SAHDGAAGQTHGEARQGAQPVPRQDQLGISSPEKEIRMQPQQQAQKRPAVLPQRDVDAVMQELREAYKHTPDYVRRALEELRDGIGTIPEALVESAGRIGVRQGVVSELT